MCTQHSERLVIFIYTKTNLLVTKGVVALVLVDDEDYDRALRCEQGCLVRLRCCLPLRSSVVVAVLLLKSSVVVAVLLANE